MARRGQRESLLRRGMVLQAALQPARSHKACGRGAVLRDHAPAGDAASTDVESPPEDGLLRAGLRCRRTRSASACFCRPSGAARRSRCRFVPCQRCTNRRHSGSWQYRWFHCRARYLRPHPLRRQIRHPSRRPLAGVPASLVRCTHPMGGATPWGRPGRMRFILLGHSPMGALSLLRSPSGDSLPAACSPSKSEGDRRRRIRCSPPDVKQ